MAGRESLAIYAAHLVLIEALAALGLPRIRRVLGNPAPLNTQLSTFNSPPSQHLLDK